MMINKRYGLLGEKLGHSFSKSIHESLNLYPYDLIECSETEFDALMKETAFEGLNITIPYKEKVLKYCDVIDASVQKIGAANTILKKDGHLYAYNTDYEGLMFSLDHYGIVVRDKKVMILGTGGTSKTIQALCQSLGAKEILVVSRQPSNSTLSYQEAYLKEDIQVIFNATPVGMYPNNDASPLSLEAFQHLEAVVDVIYNPLRSQLILEAQSRNIKTCNGLLMLVAQAIFAAEKFSQKSIDRQIIHSLYQKMLKDTTNIVLIGMPSSGKSSLGKMLSVEFNRALKDIDEIIESNTHRKITDIFEQDGEAQFRQVEKEAIQACAKEKGIILSTGGGSILDPQNIRSLKQNGCLFYLKRDLDLLKIEAHRPLAKDKDALKKLFEKRQALYLNSADVIIDNNGEIKLALKAIKEAFNEIFSN